MALSDILARIDAETSKQIAELKQDFEKKVKEMKALHEINKKAIAERIDKTFDEKSKNILDNAQTTAERDANNLLLQAKRDFIEEIIQEAITQLSTSSQYDDIMVTMLKEVTLTDAEVVPATGREEATRKAIKAAGKDFSLSSVSGNFKGGFIVKTAKIEMDNSFETIVGNILREDLEMDLNKLLFNEK